MDTRIAKVYEVYGQAENGSRHQLGMYFAKNELQANRKAKKDFPGYTDFHAMFDHKLTKNDFYANYYNHSYNWCDVVFKGN